MLFLFRHLPRFQQRTALGAALVLLFLASVGEAFHYKTHSDTFGSAPTRASTRVTPHGFIAASASAAFVAEKTPAVAAVDDFCALCQWESTLATEAAFAFVFAWAVIFALLRACFAARLLSFVRFISALRTSRGPPSLA